MLTPGAGSRRQASAASPIVYRLKDEYRFECDSFKRWLHANLEEVLSYSGRAQTADADARLKRRKL